MVCRFIDSFDYYSTADMSRKWTNTNLMTIDSDARTGFGALRMANSNVNVQQGFDLQSSWVVGAAFKTSAFVAVQNIFQFLDVGTIQVSLRVNSDGTLEVYRSGTISVAGGVSTFVLTTGTYFYIEWKVTISNSIPADSCIVKINGIERVNVDAGEDVQGTVNSTANIFRIVGASGSINLWDDLYVFDQTGSENNDFIGDAFVSAHFPDGNGTTSDFDGSDGNSIDNYLLVDENPTDDDATYVESSTAGDIDLYTFDGLTGSANIKAVQINNVVKKTDAGSRTMRAVTRPTSTNFFGASKGMSVVSYLNEIEILEQDPETAAIWTKARFNATEFGIETET